MPERSLGLRHADQPDGATDAKTSGRSSPGLPWAIVRELRKSSRPIVMGPLLYLELQDRAPSYLCSSPERDAQFGVPAAVEDDVKGSEVRIL